MTSVPFCPNGDDENRKVPNVGGRTTTTAQGIAHVAPESSGITPELLDTHDAARLLAIGERTLWRWSRSGICPAPVRIGRGLRAAIRFRRAELMQWITDGCPRVDKGGRR